MKKGYFFEGFSEKCLSFYWNFIGSPVNEPAHLINNKLYISALPMKSIGSNASDNNKDSARSVVTPGFAGIRRRHLNFEAVTRMTFDPADTGE